MRVLRVIYRGQTFYASLTDDKLICLNKNLGLNDPIPLQEVTVVPPVMPTKVVGAALNYHDQLEELGREPAPEPLIFLKPPSCIIGTGQPIVLPQMSTQVNYEGELAMVIGKTCRNVAPDGVGDHVFGYACANDVTAMDLIKRDTFTGRGKGFDTFCPVGPWIETEVPDPDNLNIRTRIGDKLVQDSNTSKMVASPFELVSYISRIMTLLPGDVVLTGSPAGVSAMQAGDEVRVEIDTVGVLINPVEAEVMAATDASIPDPEPDDDSVNGDDGSEPPLQ